MPATPIVIHERKGAIAARVMPLVHALPVLVRETRSVPAFCAAVAELPFPIVCLEPDLDPTLTAELLRHAQASHAATLVFARPRTWPELFEFRERGARAVLDPLTDPEQLAHLFVRLVDQARGQLRVTG